MHLASSRTLSTAGPAGAGHPPWPGRPAMRALAIAAAVLAAGAPRAVPAKPGVPAPELLRACRACHGADGISNSPGVPNLAGQKMEALLRHLQAFRQGTRKNDLMAAVATQLDDLQMRQLAQHWADQPAVPATPGPAVVLPSRMAFPPGFPQGFHLYQTLVQGQQVTRRWANTPAWQAAAAGQPLPDGSTLVVVNHGPDRLHDGKAMPGPVRSYAAMASRSGWGDTLPPLLRNGDWHFALFNADGQRREGLNQAPCLACHRPLAARSHVFTLELLRTAARAAR